MTDIIELDPSYSTTGRVIKADPQEIAGLVTQSNKPEDKFETVLFLPEGENRQGECGLRTQGYFKKAKKISLLLIITTVVYCFEKFLVSLIRYSTMLIVQFGQYQGNEQDKSIKRFPNKVLLGYL